MAKVAPIITALNQGQFSSTLDGRVDFDKYAGACKLLQNCIGLIQGPAQRRGGSKFVTEHKDSADRVWGIRFEFSATQAFVLEFGDAYCRFLRIDTHAYQVPSGEAAWSNATAYVVGDLATRLGVTYYCILAHTNQQPPNATYWYALTSSSIYEIPSPYALADLTNSDGTCALKTEQSGDVVYIANETGAYPVMKLTRLGDSRWTFTEYAPDQGPFLPMNETAVTIQASAATGSVTLTASAATFAATDVGRLVRLESQNLTVVPWETSIAKVIGNQVRSNGKTYVAASAATTGSQAPSHEQGNAFDGTTGVNWTYSDSGYGVLRITAFTSSTQVTATVISDPFNGLVLLPSDVVSAATARWRLGAWSDTTGYPRAVAFWKFRLFLTGTRKVWASVPNDFENHSPDNYGRIEIDNALDEEINSQDVNEILWIVGASKLLIGTTGGEFVGDKITTNDPVGPGNFELDRSSKRRVRAVQPEVVGTSVLYCQRAGRKLLALNYNLDLDTFASSDLAVLANRITRGGIIAVAYQSEPDSLLWVLLNNGRLLGFTYDLEQNVTGWHYHPIGGDGYVESIVTVPADSGDRDELWISVKRTIDGSTKRYWEYLKKPWEGPDDDGSEGDDQKQAFYVDSGASYNGNVLGTSTFPTALLSAASYASGQSGTVTVTLGDVSYTVFTAGDVGNRVHFYLPDGRIYKVSITGYTSATQVTVQLLSDTPAELQGVSYDDWGLAKDVIDGLDHLEGETVQVLADGAVHPDCVVTGGEIELQTFAAYVHAGYQMVSRIVPMRIEAGSQDGTSQGKTKRTNKITIRFIDTLGGKVGMFGQTLDSLSRRSTATPMGAPEPFFSGDVKADMPGLYETDGLIEIRQDQPLPMMVAAIMPQSKTYDP